jgi:hypothetical protein
MFTKPSERTIVGCQRLAISYPSSTVASFTADVSGNVGHPKPAPQSVAAILKNGTDKAAPATREVPILFHANIRGRGYYN